MVRCFAGFRIVAVLLLGAAIGMAGQGGAKRPVGGQRIVNPESIAAKLMLATPEQRARALARFPAERQAEIRKQLEWFDSLPKAQQDMQIRRLERFNSLPPDKQVAVRLQMQALSHLPPPRRQAIRAALTLLQNLPEGPRNARMNSPAFKARFSPEELTIINDLADAWLLP